MKYKLAIIVPYRNREKHLEQFIPYMHEYLSKTLDKEYCIVVVEQANSNLFNRGSLINIGFKLIGNDCEYISPHDVDLLPETENLYFKPEMPTHLSAFRSQNDYKLEYDSCFGGVNLFLTEHFNTVNGFSNLYAGYGAEDDDLYYRCMLKGLIPTRRMGRYTSLPHGGLEGKELNDAFIKNRNFYYKLVQTKQTTINDDGLNSISFELKNLKEEENYLHYFVDFKNC